VRNSPLDFKIKLDEYCRVNKNRIFDVFYICASDSDLVQYQHALIRSCVVL
jgi:hypothetical protein